eukprot:XP_001696813.1 predicted protein [Chlamydomonas reinhardtii]
MAAVDRLRSFYGDQLLCRTGTLASIKSFGSAVSGAASAVSGGEASTVADGAKQHRPGDEDVVIDPYQLDPDGSSSSDDDDDGLSRPDSGSGLDDDEEGDMDETEWTSASGDEAGSGPGSQRSAAEAASGRGARSVAAMSAHTARTAKSRKAPNAGRGDVTGGETQRGGKGVSIAETPSMQGPRAPRSVAASNWGARSRRSVATTARSAATSAANSAALSAVPSGAPGGVVSVQKLDAKLEGKAVRRRLLRRRGWEFDLVPDEVDYTLGRELPHVLTRPQPTADSDEELEEEGGGNDDDDEDSVDARAGGSPPPGPVLEAIKSYAHERAPEVVWSERVKHAKRVARHTGQTVTVRGRLEPKKRRELARKVDDDGGGTLDREELLTALQASDVPVKPENIDEMIVLMDLDRDGVISWKEFVTFFMYEFAAGKNLLSGEYVLPSGVALPFGAMIAKLKRDRLVADLMEGGHARAKWQNIAESPIALEDELGMMAAVELAMEEMKNPALGRARARATKALNKLPPHLRTPSIARHLQRHPEVADKLLRAPSMAALMAATSLKRAPSAGNIMARLASTNSNGSIASRNSSMAGGGAGSTGGGSTGGGGGGGGAGASGGRTGNVDLNVAVAMAAGLEWPVEGASFYNKRAKTVLRAACQKPPDAILRANQSAASATGAASGATARAAAAHAITGVIKQASGRKGLSVEAVAAVSATAAAMDGDTAQRREEEERQELRERLMGGASSKSMAASALAGRGSRSARASASTDADTPRRRSGLVEGGEEEEEGLWVSPLLKRWLTVERERLQHPSAELALASETEPDNMTAAATGEVAGTAAASAQQGIIASAVPSRAASVTTAREVEMSDVDVSSPHAVTAAATLGTGRAMSSTLDGDTEGLASAGVATPAAARKPRRRMRFVDEQEDATPAEEESTAAVAAAANSGAFAEEDALAALAGRSLTTASSAGPGTAPAVFLGSMGPHTCAVGVPLSALSPAGASVELPDDPSNSSLRTTRRSVLLSPGPADGGDGDSALQPPYAVAHGQSPRASGLLRTSRLEAASPSPGGVTLPPGEAPAAAAPAGTSPLRSSYGPALQQWALGSAAAAAAEAGDADTLEPLDAEEARELMAGITLQLSKEDTLYHIHTGHEADRPTTSDFRAALTRMRVAAAALVHSYALPPHPEYSGAAVSPFTAGLFTEASQPQLTHPPLQQPAGSAAPQPPGRLYGLSPHHRPHPQLPLHRPDSPTTAVALSARPSAVSVTAAHGTTALTSAERNRGRTRSGAGVTEDSGGGGGATAGASARSRGAKVAQQSPHQSYTGRPGDDLTPEASQPFGLISVAIPGDSGQALSGWSVPGEMAAPGVFVTPSPQPQPPRHSPDPGILAAAIATARSMSRAGSSRPASRARSPSPLRAGSSPPARGGSRPGSRLESPASSALFAPMLPHQQTDSGSGTAVHATARTAIGGAVAAGAPHGLVPAQRSHSVGPPAAAQDGASLQPPPVPEAWDARVAALLQRHTAVELAAVQQHAAMRSPSPDGDLLPPRASDPFPDFIYMAGAMPRLQSRYAAKRPVPAAAAAQQQLTGGDLSAGGIPVHAWGGEGDSSGAAGRQLSLPHPAETRSYNTHDGSRPPSAGSEAAALRLREHPMLPPTPPATTAEAAAGHATAAALEGVAPVAGGEIAMQSPHPQQQLALQHDQGAPPAPDVQASRRELLLQPSHVKDELQEQSALGDTPRGTPVALSPYTGSGVMASGFRLPNPSRLKGTSAKVVLPEMPPPQAGGPPGTSSLGGWSPPGNWPRACRAALAGRAPAADAAASCTTSAGDAVGGSLLSDLPDIVALLSQDPAPQRTGPIRIEKIDI